MIITHTSPDFDAIGAVWLLKRYGGMADAPVAFVNTGSPAPALLTQADAVVDTGREYDPARLRFDHHQLPGAAANETCATLQVFQWLTTQRSDLTHLNPLVALIYAGDTGRADYGADWSRQVGIHALLSSLKATRPSDAALLAYGMGLLDTLAEHLETRARAAATLAQYTVYRSDDGLVRGLVGAPQGATFAAFEDGARLVLFTSDNRDHDPPSVAVGVMRGGEGQEPNCRALVLGLLNDGECEAPWAPRWDTPEYRELARWFCHPAGFFAGRGTAKAPMADPLDADFGALCAFLDRAWRR